MALDLEAIVDLEWLLRDRNEGVAVSDAERQAAAEAAAAAGVRGAELRARLATDRGLRQRIALAWLQVARRTQPELPGAQIARGLAAAGWLLGAFGFLCGWWSARTLLAYDGTAPVNVMHYVAVMFAVQIVLLGLLVWFAVRSRRAAAPGVAHQGIAWLAGFIAGKLSGRGAEMRDALRTLHSRHGIYAAVERWTLFALAQRFGFAFNLGAVGAAWFTVAFSDLQFCWSTTFDLAPATGHAIARWLALPWAWLPAAVPTLDLVTASQWARMPGAYVGGITADQALRLAPQWWSFLIAGSVAYGLLPRCVAWLAGSCCARRALAAAGCDHAGFQELFERLLPPSTDWQGPAPDAVRGAAPAPRSRAQSPVPAAAGAQTVVVWGSLARHSEAVGRELMRRGGHIAVTAMAGGADLVADDQAIARATGGTQGRIVVAVAAGHQPTRDVLGFLRRLRQAAGSSRPLLVTLLEPMADGTFAAAEPDEHAAWRRSLGALDDPYLWVDGSGGAA